MKTTDYFKQTIQSYLERRAAEDTLFALVYANPAKNIDDCVTHILNTVKASGCNGFADAEIYSMAVHYYDETDIEIGNKTDMQVVVNHTIVLTEEEKAQARQNAINKATDEAYAKFKTPAKVTAKKTENTQQTLLF